MVAHHSEKFGDQRTTVHFTVDAPCRGAFFGTISFLFQAWDVTPAQAEEFLELRPAMAKVFRHTIPTSKKQRIRNKQRKRAYDDLQFAIKRFCGRHHLKRMYGGQADSVTVFPQRSVITAKRSPAPQAASQI